MRLPRRRRDRDLHLVRVGTGRRGSARVRLVGDGSRSLGDGMVLVEAGIVARLLGVRLLRLDARVLLAPAAAAPGPARPSPTTTAPVEVSSRIAPATDRQNGQALTRARALLADAEAVLPPRVRR